MGSITLHGKFSLSRSHLLPSPGILSASSSAFGPPRPPPPCLLSLKRYMGETVVILFIHILSIKLYFKRRIWVLVTKSFHLYHLYGPQCQNFMSARLSTWPGLPGSGYMKKDSPHPHSPGIPRNPFVKCQNFIMVCPSRRPGCYVAVATKTL